MPVEREGGFQFKGQPKKISDVVLLVPSCRAKKSESSVSRRISNENGIEKPCFFKVLGLVELRVKNLQRTKAFEN